MLKNPDYRTARKVLIEAVEPVETESVDLWMAYGRVLAETIVSAENVPPFDRSPYDGYAFRSEDTKGCDRNHPVTLRILEEVPAGSVATKTVTGGTAVKILTGAPIPSGADAVVMFEKTEFTDETVTLFQEAHEGENIIRAGEDVKKGTRLIEKGTRLDEAMLGTIAAQGKSKVLVYRIVKVGILSTGSEVTEVGEPLQPGKIYNSNRYTLMGTLRKYGMEPEYLGLAGDDIEAISALFQQGLTGYDAIISTGGVSVGDYDLTPAAMEKAGVQLLIQRVNMKPGMACAFGICDGKPVFGLSGNPASSLTNFYAIVLPALKKLCGQSTDVEEITMTLASGFKKKSPSDRFLRGTLDLSNGTVYFHIPKDQGNVVLSSSIGCDAMAVVPAGSGPLEEGTVLKGFKL